MLLYEMRAHRRARSDPQAAWAALFTFLGRPSTRPRALARASPAFTRSRIIARSNSANTPHIWNYWPSQAGEAGSIGSLPFAEQGNSVALDVTALALITRFISDAKLQKAHRADELADLALQRELTRANVARGTGPAFSGVRSAREALLGPDQLFLLGP
jgi:hypothetical protein